MSKKRKARPAPRRPGGGKTLPSRQGGNSLEGLFHKAQEQPQDAQALAKLGLAFMERQEFEQAIEVHRLLCQARPQDAGAHNALGVSLIMAQRQAEALPVMQKAASLEPNNCLFLGNAAKLLMMEEKWHLAQVYLERALAAAPGDEKPKYQQVLDLCLERMEEALSGHDRSEAPISFV